MNCEDLFFAISTIDESELEKSEEYLSLCSSSHHRFRTILLIAAIILALGGMVFAVSKNLLGTIYVEEKLIPISITEDQNRNFHIRICDMYTSDQAPVSIKEYFLPEIPEEMGTLVKNQCYVIDRSMCFYPYRDLSEENIPLEGAPIEALWEWDTHGGQQITFTQTAIGALEDEYRLNIQMSDDQKLRVDYRRIMVEEIEVFAFTMDFSNCEDFAEQEHKSAYAWIWSDGNYLYRLTGSPGISEEDLTDLLRSLSPQDPNLLFEIN